MTTTPDDNNTPPADDFDPNDLADRIYRQGRAIDFEKVLAALLNDDHA